MTHAKNAAGTLALLVHDFLLHSTVTRHCEAIVKFFGRTLGARSEK